MVLTSKFSFLVLFVVSSKYGRRCNSVEVMPPSVAARGDAQPHCGSSARLGDVPGEIVARAEARAMDGIAAGADAPGRRVQRACQGRVVAVDDQRDCECVGAPRLAER